MLRPVSLIDHVSLVVSDFARSKAFYEKALAPLGVRCLMQFGKAAGFGRADKPDFWIGEGPTTFQTPDQLSPITPTHLAFGARSRDAFHAAALAAGGRDYGAPGLRERYHPHYYGAFVLDPDGHDIEAVIHTG
jgi:catechol 2,3-dioxygenase-like lactoylglutathione lyase family enzyme